MNHAADAHRDEPASLRQDLARAPDQQLARVVAMVDALPDRGAADGLIAPLRPRLAQLRPARPPNFVRIMFTPLDALIVPQKRWRPGLLAVPRSAVAPLSRAARQEIGPGCAALDAAVAERGYRAGPAIWPGAAAALARAAPPPGWAAETGLADADYAGLRDAAAAVLRLAGPIEALLCPQPPAALAAALRRLLDDAAARPRGAAFVVALLLARHARPDILISALDAGGVPSAVRPAVDAAIGHALDGSGPALETGDLAAAAGQARRVAALLDGLGASSGLDAAMRARLEEARQRAAASCQERFAQGMARELLHPLAALPPVPDDAAVLGLEEAARNLRRIEGAGRVLGGRGNYDAMLRQAAARLGPGAARALDRTDRARLVELLLGPEAAEAVLAEPESA